jgi:hypothetical protein
LLWRVIRPGDGGFDEAWEHFEGDDEAGGAVGIFTQDEGYGFRLFSGRRRGG